jgi:hypothetical protein
MMPDADSRLNVCLSNNNESKHGEHMMPKSWDLFLCSINHKYGSDFHAVVKVPYRCYYKIFEIVIL